MLSQQLIENALALCGKTMEDMQEIITGKEYIGMHFDDITEEKFSIEKFGWYLLSPEFIGKYVSLYYNNSDAGKNGILPYCRNCIEDIGIAIYEYQSGNEKPLIELLSKINGK